MHTYCTRDSTCVGTDIGIGSLSVSTYHINKTSTNSCVDRLNSEACFTADAWHLLAFL